MSYHIAVGIVNAKILVFARAQALDKLIGNLGAFHPRTLLKGNDVGGNLNIGFKLLGELTRFISVPEISYVTVFLCFGYCKLIYACADKIFGHSSADFGRINEIS